MLFQETSGDFVCVRRLANASTLNSKHGFRFEPQHAELTERIVGIFYDVYNELGYGFLESVYEEALVIALTEAGIMIDRQIPLPVWFRGSKVGDFRADLMVHGRILLELKSARTIEPCHEAQLLHYLKSTEVEIGLLLNFGAGPQFRRLLFDNERKKIRANPCKSVAEEVRESAANEVLA